jgi:prostaglandin-E synthase
MSPLSMILGKINKTPISYFLTLLCNLLYCLISHYLVMPEKTQIPRVLWAQQRETVLLTIAVPDIEKVDVKFEESSVNFHGESTSTNAKDKNIYAVKIDLHDKIDPDACKYENIGQKYWRILLKKKDDTAAFWPRLTKDKTRLHWLQTDFDHWKDGDESDEEKAGFDGNFQDMFSGGKRKYSFSFYFTIYSLLKVWVAWEVWVEWEEWVGWVAWTICQAWVMILMKKKVIQMMKKNHQ